MKKVLGIFAIALCGGLVALGINGVFNNFSDSGSFEEMQAKHSKFASLIADDGKGYGFDFVKVSAVSTPAVVHIKSHFDEEMSNNPHIGGNG